MEHLTEAMRAAAAAPPPTAIDLDDLIAGEHRASRRRHWAAGLGAAAAVLAVAGALAFGPSLTLSKPDGTMRAGDPGDTKTVPVPDRPQPTTAQRDEALRLTAVFTDAFTAIVAPAGDWDVAGFTWEANTGLTGQDAAMPGYTGSLVLTADGATNKIYVLVRRAPMPTDTCAKDWAPEVECTVQTRADGSQVWRATSSQGGQVSRTVEVYRPDGVHIMVADIVVSRLEPALSMAQLLVLADTEALAPTVL